MRAVAASVLLLLLVASGCNRQSSAASSTKAEIASPIGARCTVQFRRDVLGGSMDVPVSPTTDRINGVDVSVTGELVDMTSEWIVLERHPGGVLWIPRQNVLLLRF